MRLSQKKIYRDRREKVMGEVRRAVINNKPTPMWPPNAVVTSEFGMMYQTDLDRQTNEFARYVVDLYNHRHHGFKKPEIPKELIDRPRRRGLRRRRY